MCLYVVGAECGHQQQAQDGDAMQFGAALVQQVVDGGIQPGMSEPGVYLVPAAGHLMFQAGCVLGQTVE